MKKAIVFVLITAVPLVFMSCTDNLLDEDARTQVTDNYLNSATGFNDAVNAAYSFARVYTESENFPQMTVYGTDTFANGWGGNDRYLDLYDDHLNPRAGRIYDRWVRLYEGINTCNAVISRAPDVTGMNESVKNVRVAEAKFLRAQWYFLLVQWFGPIPLTLEETQGVETEATRAPIADVYTAIINDLNDAIQTLPDVAADYGRATKPAAEHLLAKVYLTRAGTEAAQSGDYQNAVQLSQNVIHNYNFQLLDDFAMVFEQGEAAERHEEVVWAVRNSKDFQLNGGNDYGNGNTLHAYFLMKYDQLPGMVRDIENGRTWTRFRPTNFVTTTLFDKENDSRYEKSFKRVFYCNQPGTYTSINGYEMILAEGDTAIYVVDEEWTEVEIAEAGYHVFTPSVQTDRFHLSLTKFLDPERPAVNEMSGSRDFMVMRLAETYLIAAEALMMMGNLDEAATYVNAVRRRAAIQGATQAETEAHRQAMEITPDQLDIDFILDERARELLGELMRWFDLVRTGKLIERVKLHNPGAAANIEPHHVLRPIPQNQIDRTSTEFPQNPGYN
jgi:starch-binding outer membrane protein, SusD/RagB family